MRTEKRVVVRIYKEYRFASIWYGLGWAPLLTALGMVGLLWAQLASVLSMKAVLHLLALFLNGEKERAKK